jgi:hypothetical protein
MGLLGCLGGCMVGFEIGWTRFGGYAYQQHRELRRHLEQAGVIPHDYVQFLDFAAEHALLQRIGGGYRFIHALLLDYFADRWAESAGTQPIALTTQQVSRQVSV